MHRILRGRRWGFSLEEIRQWLLIYESEGTRAQMEAWVELADRQLGVLAEEKARLETSIQELQDTRDQVAKGL